MPNAGLPQRVEGRFVYAAEPAVLRRRCVPRFLDAGARIVGGCCGTTPAHIAAMRAGARRAEPARAGRRAHGRRLDAPRRARRRTPADRRSPSVADSTADGHAEPPPPTRLAPALADGRFVISVEIDPPRIVRIERTIEAARLLQDAGVDLVNISD